jgi:hypothetical protein
MMRQREEETKERNRQRETKAKKNEESNRKGAMQDYERRQREIKEREKVTEEER